jgi:glycosyltransferase involved in cell wall biosynthesis
VKLKIALLGTRGVPANYGGFETCAEEVSGGLAARGHAVTVYCRRGNAPADPAWDGDVRLRYTGHIEHKAMGTLTHTLTATLDAVRRDFDVLLYFNAANALPAVLARLLCRAPVVLNVDGLEWKRRKWGFVGRTYYQFAEWLSTKVATRIVSDAAAIQAYYERRWKTSSTFIAYGAHVTGSERPEILAEYGLERDSYFLTASRLEPENNADLAVRAFAQVRTDKKLVFVGGANYDSRFVRELRQTPDPRVVFLGPVYKPGHIRELHCGAFAYVHGNEVGGTNPALLKAMGYGNCVLALDVPFNAEVVADGALLYRKDPMDLAAKMRRLLDDPELVRGLRQRARERVRAAYRWEQVVLDYERVLERAVAGDFRGRPPSDRASMSVPEPSKRVSHG